MDIVSASHVNQNFGRVLAREAQRHVELQRLVAHQKFGIDLLCSGRAVQEAQIALALQEVDRWQALKLCSNDYVARWREWLSLPVHQWVPLMCSDAEGWGAAMRQNSPFAVSGYAVI